MKDSTVSAPGGWGGRISLGSDPGSIFCINPSTGEDRANLEALRFGDPEVKPLRPRPPPSELRFVAAPYHASETRSDPRGSLRNLPGHYPNRDPLSQC